jgi:hypothetical protein
MEQMNTILLRGDLMDFAINMIKEPGRRLGPGGSDRYTAYREARIVAPPLNCINETDLLDGPLPSRERGRSFEKKKPDLNFELGSYTKVGPEN